MISCQRAAELLTQSLEAPLTWPQWWALRLHLGICAMCRQLRRQQGLLTRAARLLGQGRPPAEPPSLPPDAAARIREALRQQGAEGPKPGP